ncbi:unnamed protein product [Mytilus edulis]|uniref:Uncharacterized protein n=1 Tax=Mytilus edulis TaxID=6550 RepID=A0A8S3R2T4_MYTED|nr:unnamed protein product [Mytilus edulis]
METPEPTTSTSVENICQTQTRDTVIGTPKNVMENQRDSTSRRTLSLVRTTPRRHAIAGTSILQPNLESGKTYLTLKSKKMVKHRNTSRLCRSHNSLVQLVNQPTRGNNTLDLFLTNKPSTIYRTEVCPGISDHDIVYAEATTTPIKENQTPRKVYQYKKADFETMKAEVNNFGNDFIINH